MIVTHGDLSDDTDEILATLIAQRVASRLGQKDAGLWGAAAADEARIRLGWVDAAERAAPILTAVERLRAELTGEGIDRIVLCGMGGSSLAPEVICAWSGAPLTVLDSTHPEQVARALDGDLHRTAVVVSSKSGSTVETRSHRAVFEARFRAEGIDPAERIIVVTDPGSPLEVSATEAGQRVVLADPNVGGRYSALTAFGLVPAGLAGADVRRLVADARAAGDLVYRDASDNPALVLAASIYAQLPERYAMVLAEEENARWGLGDWIEQLVAESTGKDGTGVLPVVDQRRPERTGVLPASAFAVALGSDPAASSRPIGVHGPLGAQMLVWETATAVLGHLMGIDPFDQPDVESAKRAARTILDEGGSAEASGHPLGGIAGVEVLSAPSPLADPAALLDALWEQGSANGYLAIQAYLDRDAPDAAEVEGLQLALERDLARPVTFGWGPRYLHSTGQLHKGGPRVGTYLQILDEAGADLEIPDADTTFRSLIDSQAQGDREILAGLGRPVFTLRCSDPVALVRAIRELSDARVSEA